jgi:phytoene desaturase
VRKKIIIIGSGFGGLAAAIRLAAKGHKVEIYEKLDKPGGRAYVHEINGFKFDGGPTVITAPFLFNELFGIAGKKQQEYFTLKPINPFYRIFNHEGKYFDYSNDINFSLSEIEKFSTDDKPGYLNFIKKTKGIFQKGFIELADKPFLSFWDMVKVAPDLIRLKSYKSVYSYVSSFIKNDFLRQCFSFHPLLIGGNPFETTSIYALIHHLEREWGIHYAIGGTGSIVNGLAKLLDELGGKIHCNSEVKEISIKNGKAAGIVLENGSQIESDLVVSNADVAFTYMNLIDKRFRKKYTDKKIENMKYSMSLFVIYFGTKKRYNNGNLAHHNIILGKRYKGLLEDIFKNKILADDFSLYLHMPTITDSTIAPGGCEAFYALSPVPNLKTGINWEQSARPYRDKIMKFLEENYLPDLRENIIAEYYIDPLHFQNNLNSFQGTAFSLEPLFSQSAWFRPHNRSDELENLYFVGAGTHPGAGIPGVLSSAKIVDKLIDKNGN